MPSRSGRPVGGRSHFRPRSPRRPGRATHDSSGTSARAVLALLSALVLVVSGYAWSHYRQLLNGLETSDVTDGAGADGATDILLVGMDSRTDAHGNPLPDDVLRELHAGANDAALTDSLILLHIPNDGSGAVGFSFPRDTYTTIPGEGRHKINSAYGRGKQRARDQLLAQGVTDPAALERRSADAGRKLLVRTVEQLTGASVDHYAEVNLLGFARITEAVGGVPVCLKAPARDDYSGADFHAGPQTVSGADALAFVRQRHGLPRGDLDRVVRQQAFLAGLARSALSTGVLANPSRLQSLIGSVQESIVLDRGWDVMAFAERMRNVAAGALRFTTIPIEDPAYDTPADGQAVLVDPSAVRAAVTRTATSPQAVTRAAATVDVRNASRNTGLAQRVRSELASHNIAVGDTGNTAASPTSTVRYAPGAEQTARRVAALLGGLPTAADSSLGDGRVRVVLGADYRGPAAPGVAPTPRVALDGGFHQQSSPDPGTITADGIPCVS
ncbi:LCP family protein [Saccharopolyspora rosea]|uniref:LCP family protein n=1 Tax=Saccharopolyspora rosea TaxID=524884 RepID=A0ABW3FPD6_9PSEU|nr:LCP family protein [Saccharopolyspora rosea]